MGKRKYVEFGKRLTYWMARRGIAPGQLRDLMGVKEGSTVSRWRAGHTRPSDPDLLRLAKILGVPVNRLSPGFAPDDADDPIESHRDDVEAAEADARVRGQPPPETRQVGEGS